MRKTIIEYPFISIGNDLWQWGCRLTEEHDDSYSGIGSSDFQCDGIGQRIIEELSRAKMPGRYQDRVIYSSYHIDPSGFKTKKIVLMTTVKGFKKILKGFPIRTGEEQRGVFDSKTGREVEFNEVPQ